MENCCNFVLYLCCHRNNQYLYNSKISFQCNHQHVKLLSTGLSFVNRLVSFNSKQDMFAMFLSKARYISQRSK